jgi:hypothetical protein
MILSKQSTNQTEKNQQIEGEKIEINKHIYRTNCMEWDEFNMLKKKQRELSLSYDQNMRVSMAQQKKKNS